ncbi:MAG TPA: DUF3656 domain-containing protein [Methanothrix sp.]|nr:DUF3656 domain-containing protein [Methanothrix sp.]
MRRLPELLSPAGSPEALKAAVAAGADAVYLSGKKFGARKFAVNFDEAQLAKAMDYAHLRGVRVYVTVNTLVRDDEMQEAGEYLIRLYEMGADAVLVQDLGAASLARRILPDLNLHASTQMTIHNSEGVAWAARMSFQRVVLAREVTLDEIQGMARLGSGLGLEVFVHGALCYSYSGQCLLSSAIGGRSGNRGMCAQPCRKSYVILKGEKDEYGRPTGLRAEPLKEKFLISTRDLAVYRNLEKIVRSPVESIKIEGRMKSPEYVAIVTSIYRKALDEIAKGRWTPSEEEEWDLALAFNRDFTEGYILGARDIMGREMSDNRGILVGSVMSYDSGRGEAAVRLIGPLAPEQGDGLVFIGQDQEMGVMVQRPYLKDSLLRLRTPDRVRLGAKVYLTGSTVLARKAKKIISSERTGIPIDLHLSWEEGVPTAEARIDGGISVHARADFRMERARSLPLTALQIESQMRKTGGTPFSVRKVNMSYPGDLFAPQSALNRLRRDLLAKAEQAVLESRHPGADKVAAAQERLIGMNLSSPAPAVPRAPSLAVYADSLEAVRGASEAGAARIYFEPRLGPRQTDREERTLELIQEAKAACCSADLVWKWPKITRQSFLDLARPLLDRAEADGVMVENVGAAEAALAAKQGARLFGASGLNVWNHLAVGQLVPPFELLTLSPELSAEQLASTVARSRLLSSCAAVTFELVVQGSLEVMVSEDCLPLPGKAEFWGLQDFRRVFPLRLDDDSRTHVYNSAETCLVDFMPRIFEIGLDGIAVDARGRTGKYAREMTEIYARAIDLTKKRSESLRDDLAALKEEARRRSIGGITIGHFVKGLKGELT